MSKYKWYLSNLVAFIRLILFVKVDLQTWLDKPFEQPHDIVHKYSQGVLFLIADEINTSLFNDWLCLLFI